VTPLAPRDRLAGMSNDAHARPAGASGRSLDAPAPSHAERARTLLEAASAGTLCTLAREPAGYPYGSLITFGISAGDPVFLISELAEHTKNLRADARASLLVAENRPGDPLANGRVTLLGQCLPATAERRARASASFLARHPGSASYAEFGDFNFWCLEVNAVRFIGGYGRMSWLSVEEWRAASPDPIAPDAAAILAHMNQDHADALPAYCQAFSAVGAVLGAEMTHIDRFGFEMSVRTPAGTETVRIGFREPIATKADARTALVGLLKEARAKLGGG
jgi:putative heme iron utilization protein